MAYPGYGASGQPGQPVNDPLYGYFSAVAGADQQIDSLELTRCLTASGISGSYQPFSHACSRTLIAMLDRDYSGKMGFNEFKEVWGALNQWKNTFMSADRDRSGTVEAHELHGILVQFGYQLSPSAMGVIVKRFGVNGRITFDDFVHLCISLRMLTEQFKRQDSSQNGEATFRYDDFIQVAISAG